MISLESIRLLCFCMFKGLSIIAYFRIFVKPIPGIAGKIFSMRTVFWEDNQLKMIDQRILPGRFEVVSYSDHKSVAKSITDMVVRGAPAIGAAAAFGLALAGFESTSTSSRDLLADYQVASNT